MYVVKWSESNVSLHLSPRRNLVDGPLRTLDLSCLQCRGSGKLVVLLIRVLGERERTAVIILANWLTKAPSLAGARRSIFTGDITSGEYRVQRRHTDSKTNSLIVNITIR